MTIMAGLFSHLYLSFPRWSQGSWEADVEGESHGSGKGRHQRPGVGLRSRLLLSVLEDQ